MFKGNENEMKRSQIVNLANDTIQTYSTKNPYEIADVLGIEVVNVALPERTRGCLLLLDGIWVIMLNEDLDDHTARMTMAHELGHYFLHRDLDTVFMDTTFVNKGKIEREANMFGIYLLYPSDTDLYDLGDTLSNIHASTGIPSHILQMRLED